MTLILTDFPNFSSEYGECDHQIFDMTVGSTDDRIGKLAAIAIVFVKRNQD